MNNDISGSNIQNNLVNTFRQLWRQNILSNKTFIVNKSCNFGNLAFLTQQIIQNSQTFSDAFSEFYGPQNAKIFELLLDNHFLIAAKLLYDNIAGDTESVQVDRVVWYRNADNIAQFLSEINPYWNMTEWQNIMYNYLYMLESGLTCTYTTQEEFDFFTDIEYHSNIISDYMTQGIIMQFNI